MTIERARSMLKKLGLPPRDLYDLPDSTKRFPDGSHYRIEISGIERPENLLAMVDEAEKRGVPVHRVIGVVMGTTLLTRRELEEYARIAHDARVEVIAVPGPRTTWDLGRQVVTPEGALSGLRIRGVDQLSYALADILRAIEAGIRGFLVTDEGLLWILNELRKAGEIPKEVKLKVSIFAGHANPAGAKVLEMLGADTFNPVGDLTLPMLAAIRHYVDIPIDVHVYLFDSFGGFNRMWEAPEIARVASPCYFKIEPGPSVASLYKPWASPEHLSFLAREKVKYAEIIIELVERANPNIKVSKRGPQDLAIPKP